MRKVPFIIAGVVALTTAYAEAAPPSSPPQFPIQAPDSPRAPQSIAVISCRSDDLTGQPGRHGVDENGIYHPELAAKNWRDVELHIEDATLQCKRELVKIEDKDVIVNNEAPLNTNFGEPTQCARASVMFFATSQWDAKHSGWSVVGVGCPTPIVDDTGKIIDWHMPGCPSRLGAIQGIKCLFDESAV
jgi:hypothetical protein